MIDVTRDSIDRIVEGSPTEHVSATELWTFVRSPGGRWILSAIQQARSHARWRADARAPVVGQSHLLRCATIRFEHLRGGDENTEALGAGRGDI